MSKKQKKIIVALLGLCVSLGLFFAYRSTTYSQYYEIESVGLSTCQSLIPECTSVHLNLRFPDGVIEEYLVYDATATNKHGETVPLEDAMKTGRKIQFKANGNHITKIRTADW